MTREEAIEAIKFGHCDDMYYRKEYEEAVDMAIKALEQEPCEDCISRQAVKDILDARGVKAIMTFEYFKELLDKLPSVTPQQKTGWWIYIANSKVNGLKIVECSSCGRRTYGSGKYCSNCGAKMEREDKE